MHRNNGTQRRTGPRKQHQADNQGHNQARDEHGHFSNEREYDFQNFPGGTPRNRDYEGYGGPQGREPESYRGSGQSFEGGGYFGGNDHEGQYGGGRDVGSQGYNNQGNYGGRDFGGGRDIGGRERSYGDHSFDQGPRNFGGQGGYEDRYPNQRDTGRSGFDQSEYGNSYQSRGNQGRSSWQRNYQGPDTGYQSNAGRAQSHFDPDYSQWRDEQLRAFDDDYQNWRTERYGKFSSEFNEWRKNRDATRSSGKTGTTDDVTGTSRNAKDRNK